MKHLKVFQNDAEFKTFTGTLAVEYKPLKSEINYASTDGIFHPVYESSVTLAQFRAGIAVKLERPILDTDYIMWCYLYNENTPEDINTYTLWEWNSASVSDYKSWYGGIEDLSNNTYRILPSYASNYQGYTGRIGVFVFPSEISSMSEWDMAYPHAAPTLAQEILSYYKGTTAPLPHVSFNIEDNEVNYNPIYLGDNVLFPEIDYSKLPNVFREGDYYPEAARELLKIMNVIFNDETLYSFEFDARDNDSGWPQFIKRDENWEVYEATNITHITDERFLNWFNNLRIVSSYNDAQRYIANFVTSRDYRSFDFGGYGITLIEGEYFGCFTSMVG